MKTLPTLCAGVLLACFTASGFEAYMDRFVQYGDPQLLSATPPDELTLGPMRPLASVYVDHVSGGPERGFMSLLKTAMLERGKGTALFVTDNRDEALVVLEIDIMISRGKLSYWQELEGGWFSDQATSFEVLATAKDPCGATIFETEVNDTRWVDGTTKGPPYAAARLFKAFKKELRKKGTDLNRTFQGGTTCRMK